MTALMEFWLDTGSIIESSRQTLPLSQKQKSRQPKTTQVPSLQVSTSATKGNNCSLPPRSSDCLLSGCCWRTPRRGLNFFSLLVRRTSIALKLHSECYLNLSSEDANIAILLYTPTMFYNTLLSNFSISTQTTELAASVCSFWYDDATVMIMACLPFAAEMETGRGWFGMQYKSNCGCGMCFNNEGTRK